MIKDIKYKLDSEIRERPSGQPQAAVLIGLLNYNHLRDNPEIISEHKIGLVIILLPKFIINFYNYIIKTTMT